MWWTIATLTLCSFWIPVHARLNFDTFQWPNKVDEIPQLKVGDTVNVSWVSKAAPNILNLWCDVEEKEVLQTWDLPSQGFVKLNVTSEWVFPCHFQLAKQDEFGWFDSGEMDGIEEDREPRTFAAAAACITQRASSISETISSTSSTCPSVTHVASSCPEVERMNNGAQIGIGVGIGIAASTVLACVVGAAFVCRRRGQSGESTSLASPESTQPSAPRESRPPDMEATHTASASTYEALTPPTFPAATLSANPGVTASIYSNATSIHQGNSSTQLASASNNPISEVPPFVSAYYNTQKLGDEEHGRVQSPPPKIQRVEPVELSGDAGRGPFELHSPK